MDAQEVSSISNTVSSVSSMIPFPPVQIAGQVLGAVGNIASMFMAEKQKQAQQAAIRKAQQDAIAVSQNQSMLTAHNPKVVELGLGGILRNMGTNVLPTVNNSDVGRTLQGESHENGSTQIANNVLAEKGEFSYTSPTGKILIFSTRM